MLPNDTDLTVLREQGNINGFNFAFIDDHFDYHTANDIPANLDKESLAQQGSYLMPLLEYFKDKDLNKLNSGSDVIYFSLPFGVIVNYPFSWIFPMLIIAFILFFIVIGYLFITKKISFSASFKGAIPFFISLIGSALLVFLFWKFCLFVYPQYAEIEQGFPYNGYYYIAAAVFLTLTLCFLIFSVFENKKRKAANFVFPLFFWLLICTLAAFYLKGAAYFVIPGFFGIVQLWLMLRFKSPNLFLMLLLALPALFIILPFVSGFPVALGLKILFVAAILVTFLFCLFLPIFQYFIAKKAVALLCFITFNILFIIAHFKSDFTSERPKPDSLVYLLNTDDNKAWWYSYDKIIDSWTQPYFGKNPIEISRKNEEFSSKYNSGFSWKAKAPEINIAKPTVVFEKQKDSSYLLKIAPNRVINRMDIYVDENRNFDAFEVNGLKADPVQLGNSKFHIFKKRWNPRLLTYYSSNNDTLQIKFRIKGKVPDFVLYESSNDLLENKKLGVLPRNNKQIPRPFVLNDAVILKKTIKFTKQ